MWYSLGKKIIKHRIYALVILFIITLFMGWQTTKIQLSYDSNKAVPEDNLKFAEYKQFLKQFGADNNLIVIGIETDKLFTKEVFAKYAELHKSLEKISAVKSVLSIPEAVTLIKDTLNSKFISQKIFTNINQLDSEVAVFKSLPIYKNLLYNLEEILNK